jgi:hypothetical protein
MELQLFFRPRTQSAPGEKSHQPNPDVNPKLAEHFDTNGSMNWFTASTMRRKGGDFDNDLPAPAWRESVKASPAILFRNAQFDSIKTCDSSGEALDTAIPPPRVKTPKLRASTRRCQIRVFP